MKTNTERAKIAFRYCGGIAALFILLTGKLEAQTKVDEKPAMQVSFISNDPDYFVFKVNVVNANNKKAFFRVSDRNYEPLFSEAITADAYVKTIKVPKSEINVIEFRVSAGKEVIKKVFEVKVQATETVEVTESVL